jgi:aldehyde dehydrogenase (NAD+)
MSASAGGQGDGYARPAEDAYLWDSLFIGGSWVSPANTSAPPLEVFDCSTERRIGAVRPAAPEDVDRAVRAASAALPAWRRQSREERAKHLRALHRELSAYAHELTAVIAAEVGTAVRFAGAIQVGSALAQLDLTASELTGEDFDRRVRNTVVVERPVGVVAAITPWNYPLYQTMTKVAGALAAGCTIVHKPSELAPLSTFMLAQACERAGLPAGVYNVVTGTGPLVGEALAAHPDVRMVSFTGSTKAGRRVYELAARSIRRVSLELGGKSASVVLPDADLQVAVRATVNKAFLNSGQTCDAWTRLLVPRPMLADALAAAAAAAARLTLGDPFDEATRLGPLISQRQRERVRGYVQGAIEQGATAVVGGPERPAGFPHGHYFSPTVLAGVTPEMTVAREEVFGPVLAVLAHDSEDEAASIANATDYGLSAAVWSGDPAHAVRFAANIEAGQIVINGGPFNPAAPFGGVKHSGVGREMGRYGIAEFLEPTAVQLPADVDLPVL